VLKASDFALNLRKSGVDWAHKVWYYKYSKLHLTQILLQFVRQGGPLMADEPRFSLDPELPVSLNGNTPDRLLTQKPDPSEITITEAKRYNLTLAPKLATDVERISEWLDTPAITRIRQYVQLGAQADKMLAHDPGGQLIFRGSDGKEYIFILPS
jgi:hypothetical protein